MGATKKDLENTAALNKNDATERLKNAVGFCDQEASSDSVSERVRRIIDKIKELSARIESLNERM